MSVLDDIPRDSIPGDDASRENVPLDSAVLDAGPLVPTTRWDRFEAVLARLSERLNPILVKEARQALRSRQFTTTFFLMLSAGWLWSILGLALMGPAVYYSTDGPSMFYVYHMILAFPLLIVAPYAAFHSLSAERQDRTYELVSITALTARQILSGKLCGIMLQMMVYLSAIFPCLAFTYLLRGLDIFTILLVVLYTCLMSIGLSAAGLLFAALTPPRQRQIARAVVFAMLLFGCFFFNVTTIFSMIGAEGSMVDSAEFWQGNLVLLTIYLNLFALVFLSARSLLTTVCQNRSTALRVALVVSQLSMVGWFGWAQLRWGGNSVFGLIFVSTVMWWMVGALLVGESPVLSARVKRDLPQSWLGRIFLTWFTPGPATGYMFVVANMIAMSVMANFPYVVLSSYAQTAAPVMARVGGAVRVTSTASTMRVTHVDIWQTCIIATSYIVIYLGLSKWIMWKISRFGEVRLVTRVLVNVLVLMVGVFVPWTIQLTDRSLRDAGYTLLQLSNPIWTLWECCNKGVPIVGPVLTAGLPAFAILVWLANLSSLTAELKQVRIAKPPRVAEEDAELALEAAGGPARTSPWD
jgi:hypothetical protein